MSSISTSSSIATPIIDLETSPSLEKISPLLEKTPPLLKPIDRLKMWAFNEALPWLFSPEIQGEKNRDFIIANFVSAQNIDNESTCTLLEKISDHVMKQLALLDSGKISEQLLRYKSMGVLKSSVKSLLAAAKDIGNDDDAKERQSVNIQDFVDKFNKNFESQTQSREEALQILETLKNKAWEYEQGVPKIPKSSEIISKRNGMYLMYQCNDPVVKETALIYLTELLECDPLFMGTAYDLVELQKKLLQEIEVGKAQNLNTQLQRLLIKTYAISLECILLHAASQNLNAISNETKQQIWSGAESMAKFNVTADEEIKFWAAYAVQGAQHIKSEVYKLEEWFLRVALIVRSGMQIASSVSSGISGSVSAYTDALTDLKGALFHIEWHEKWFEKLLLLKKLTRYSLYDVYTFRKVSGIMQQFKREVSTDFREGAKEVVKGVVTQDFKGIIENISSDINLFYGVVAILENTVLHSLNPAIQEESIKLLLQYITIDQSSVQRRVISAFAKMLNADEKLRNTGFVIIRLLQASDHIRFDDAKMLLDRIAGLHMPQTASYSSLEGQQTIGQNTGSAKLELKGKRKSSDEEQLRSTDVFENAIKFLLRRLVRAEGDQEYEGHSLFTLISVFSGDKVFPKLFKCLCELFGHLRATDMHGNTPYHIATRNKNIPLLDAISQSMNVDINAHEYTKLNTALHIAIEQESYKSVVQLIKNGANPNVQNRSGDTPLHIAAKKNNLEIVALILNKKGDHTILNYDGGTPLNVAILKDCLEVAKLLIEKGAKIAEHIHHMSLIGYAARNKAVKILSSLVDAKSLRVSRFEIKEINRLEEEGAFTPVKSSLIESSEDDTEVIFKKILKILAGPKKKGELKKFLKTLKTIPDNNCDHHFGLTILHAVVAHQDEEATEIILKAGVDPNKQDHYGYTPLHYAILLKNNPIAKLLLDRKADPNVQNHYGETPLLIAAGTLPEREPETLLSILPDPEELTKADRLDHKVSKRTPRGMELVRLLIEAKASIETVDFMDNNVLHHAVYGKDESILKFFFHKANTTFWRKNRKGLLPIEEAIRTIEGINIQAILGDYSLKQLHEDFIKYSQNKLTLGNLLVYADELAVFKQLIKQFPDAAVHADAGPYRQTPLHIAAEKGCVKLIEAYIGEGLLLNSVDANGNTAAHIAAIYEHDDFMAKLIEGKADLKIANQDGRNCLHMAALNAKTKIVDRLIKEMPSLLREADSHGNIPLHLACREGRLENVKIMYAKYHESITAVNDDGNTPLHMSCYDESPECTTFLLVNWANLEAKNIFGITPLILAAECKNDRMVSFLLDRGADLRSQDDDGETALHKAILNQDLDTASTLQEKEETLFCPKESALVNIYNSSYETAMHQLTKKNLTIDSDNKGQIALLDLLLKMGASLKQANAFGETILHQICFRGYIHLLTHLIGKLRVRKRRIPAKFLMTDHRGNTILHKACEGNQLENCQVLIGIGFDMEIKNSKGMTPLLVAAKEGNTQVANLLLAHCADCTAGNKKGQNIIHLILSHETLNPDLFLLLRTLIQRKPSLLLGCDDNKTTPLHILAMNNHFIVLDLIIENVPGDFKDCVEYVWKKTKEGLTAFDMAVQRNHVDLARMLRTYPKDHLGMAKK